MGSPQRIEFKTGYPLIADEWAHCAPWMDTRSNGSLWWQPFICLQKGGTAMSLGYRMTARKQLLFSSLRSAVDSLKFNP